MRKFEQTFSFKHKLSTILNAYKPRKIHKNIEMIVDGDKKTVNLKIIYKK